VLLKNQDEADPVQWVKENSKLYNEEIIRKEIDSWIITEC